MRKLAWGYVLLIVPFIPLLPIIAADYVVMIPTLMIYLLGLGPVFGIIQEQPTCADCGAFMRSKPMPRVRGDIPPARRHTSPHLDTPPEV
jgi:hypothetical protein